ncbi:hypothetical protein JXA56_05195 [Candidatus Micrarchaeota archaeon]|nr:hypothetical protein [Candidatus Micrarchaeota archaeon]
MRKNHIEKPETPEISRRSFVKAAGTGLVAGLALCAASNFIAPRIANSQDSETREVAGQKVKVTTLGDSYKKVDEESEKYRYGERFPDKINPTYTNVALLQGKVTFIVAFDTKTDEKELGVIVKGQSSVGTDLGLFAALVTDATNKDLKRVRILIETGTFGEGSNKKEFVNAYIVPVNDSGNPTTHLGNGEYLIYGVTQVESRVFGNPYVMKDPGYQMVVAQK